MPGGAGHQGVDDRLYVRGALLNVGVWVLVKILRLGPGRWIWIISVFDEDELRQVLVRRGAGQQSKQVLDGLGFRTDGRIAPIRKARKEDATGVIVLPAHTGILQAGEDGWAGPRCVSRVRGENATLGRGAEEVLPVRNSVGQQRGMERVTDGKLGGQFVVIRQIGLIVVSERTQS